VFVRGNSYRAVAETINRGNAAEAAALAALVPPTYRHCFRSARVRVYDVKRWVQTLSLESALPRILLP
jgi:hypothetical protein